ncbi:hypothetical protein PVAND_005222 [Polypedilum vanderplanki]|uniref:Peptidase M14 domain-containing protein n=1 Tax=Polypedilum vanderplanki TaxID=319348 RepID=A0A9J6BZR8_POLVA|nr:hypothetical protein PVAND_005222 [Polypedilum vanderplanki]
MTKVALVLLLIELVNFCSSDPIEIKPQHTIDFNHFWTYNEIVEYLEYLDTNFHDYGHIERYGTTIEGRELVAFCIESDHHHRHSKPTIFIEAGVRPREWIGTMTALYFLHEFVEHHYEFDDILDAVDIVIIPVANPDGYVFTHTTNRLWNKNRRAVGQNCFGVDINANFHYQFVSTNDPCSENYSGDGYFSERESYQLSNFLSSPKYLGRVAMYISLQAFGEQILLPYNYFNIGGGNTAALTAVANRAIAAIRSRNPARNYQVGIGAALRGTQTGTSTDYVRGRVGIEYVFTYMLPRGSGATGYEVTEAEMFAILSETFLGLHEMAAHVAGV